jgi:hypothetical protein
MKGKSRTRAAQKNFMRNFEKKRRAKLQYDHRQYDKPAGEEES